MKVLVFTTVFPNDAHPYLGLFVYERIRHAARLATTRVVAPVAWLSRLRLRRVSPVEVRGGITVEHPTFYYVPGAFKVLDGLMLFMSVLPAITRIRRTFAFDVIDAHFGYPDGIAAVLLGQWFACPVVLTFRGSEIVMAQSRLRRMLMAWAVRRASRVIAVSAELAHLAIDLGAAGDRVTVIGNGVDCERFTPRGASADRRRLGLEQSQPLFVTVGHLVPGKGFHRVISAIRDVGTRLQTPPRLVIVGGSSYGSGHYPRQLRDLARGLGVSRHVEFTGAQPPDEVAKWLRAADLFVLASDREGCPNSVLEAMASGTPVVAAAVGGVRSLVPDWAGILYDGNEPHALEAALLSAVGRRWDRTRIRQHAETHTWMEVGERVHCEWTLAAGLSPRYAEMLAS